MELILVNTPPKYGEQWWVDNIISKVNYDSLHIITNVVFGGVYDKLRIFNECKDEKQYLYLDLDIDIKSNIDHLLRKEFTLLHAWWRPAYHTPLNSSIMSWCGDRSDIYHKFNSDPDYYMVKYHKGIDEFIYKEIEYKTYDKVCDSYSWPTDGEYPITLYNQAKDKLWQLEYFA